MKIHPKIKRFVDLLKWAGIDNFKINTADALQILKEKGATSTEAMVVAHQGFDIATDEAERIVKQSKFWEPEEIQDIAYQTFLYMNYNPDDPNFSYDDDSVKFSLIPPEEKSKEEK